MNVVEQPSWDVRNEVLGKGKRTFQRRLGNRTARCSFRRVCGKSVLSGARAGSEMQDRVSKDGPLLLEVEPAREAA